MSDQGRVAPDGVAYALWRDIVAARSWNRFAVIDEAHSHSRARLLSEFGDGEPLEEPLKAGDLYEWECDVDGETLRGYKPIPPLYVDGIRYVERNTYSEQAMISFRRDNHSGSGSRQWWSHPPTDAELDAWVKQGDPTYGLGSPYQVAHRCA